MLQTQTIKEHEMTDVYRVLCKSHDQYGNDNPEWHRLRKTGVTATDAATLLSGGSWLDLWARKTGKTEREFEPNERMQWGHWMEPVTLKAYASEWYAGREVRPSGELIQSIDYPWVLATLDAMTLHPDHGWIPLDAKNTDKYLEDTWSEGPPKKYEWQIRHQAIACGDVGASSIACTLGGNRLMWADAITTRPTVDQILRVTEEFWWHVTNDVPPDKPDHTKEGRDALNRLYEPDPAKTIALKDEFVTLDEEYSVLKTQLAEAKDDIRPIENRIKEIENAIRLAMGNNGHARINDATWKLTTVPGSSFTVDRKPYGRLTRKAPR